MSLAKFLFFFFALVIVAVFAAPAEEEIAKRQIYNPSFSYAAWGHQRLAMPIARSYAAAPAIADGQDDGKWFPDKY
ncbi:unnamed protein product [Bemisia tabaci]|uniref:Uncharacterized protein n=1 Tax=Bemisia tabaci TaxID=7038 RepID=A0A9P0AKD0_BEMTA|nr:unnamed protein product [Bemisia tabaci]